MRSGVSGYYQTRGPVAIGNLRASELRATFQAFDLARTGWINNAVPERRNEAMYPFPSRPGGLR